MKILSVKAKQKEIDFTIIEYLKNIPSKTELTQILEKLSLKPSQFIRKTERVYAELSLVSASEEELLEAMLKYPILIERPVVITHKEARIGRPPENILEIL